MDTAFLEQLPPEPEFDHRKRRRADEDIASLSSASGDESKSRRKSKKKPKNGLVGKRALRKFQDFQHACPVQVISFDPDNGFRVLYSDGEMDMVSDGEQLEPISDDQGIPPSPKEQRDGRGGVTLDADNTFMDPTFITEVIRLLDMAKFNMTPQKYASIIDVENFPRYPTTSFGLFLASSMQRDGESAATGSDWASMDAQEKRPYYEQHKINVQNYKAAIEAYEPGHAEKVAIRIFKAAKQASQKVAKARSAAANTSQGKPKRPMSAFLYFSQEERARWVEEAGNGKSMRSFQAQAAIKWRSMAEEDKNQYQQLATQDQNRYRDEMEVFQASDKTEVDGSSRRSIQRAHFDMYIKTKIKVLKRLCKTATAALTAGRNRIRIESQLRQLQLELNKANQQQDRWNHKLRRLREKFPSVTECFPQL